MKTTEIVSSMCKNELSATDIKAICKARGFSAAEAGDPALLENFLLSDAGLEKAFARLNRKEIAALHLLKLLKRPADVSVFENAIGKTNRYRGTFNQKYGDLAKQVKTRLVRNGVVAFATAPKSYGKNSKLERQLFVFPEQFHPWLPRPFDASEIKGDGEFNQTEIRKKLAEILDPASGQTAEDGRMFLDLGSLTLDGGLFTTESFLRWQRRRWAYRFKPNLQASGKNSASPLETLDYAFSLLGPDEWIEPEQLKTLIAVFCEGGEKLDAAQICDQGWKTGCLPRQKKNGKTFYRVARAYLEPPSDPNCEEFLSLDNEKNLVANLEKIPLKSLETLSWISLFKIENGRLVASPDTIRIGKTLGDFQDDPMVRWIRESSEKFSSAFETMEKRWGRHIVHENLLLAKVSNLGLRLALERDFNDGKIVLLPDDFIAFPKNLLDRVQAVVSKNGFAVRTIQSSSRKV